MKLSFSTRGWADMSFEDLIDTARQMRFHGIELYDVYHRKDFFERGAALEKYRIPDTYRKLKSNKISISCIDANYDLCEEDDSIEPVLLAVDTAESLRCSYVAVKCSSEKPERIHRRLEEILKRIDRSPVVLLIKTNRVFCDTGKLRALLDEYSSDSLGALWDVHHSFRHGGESADTTIANLGAYVKHVHLRDSDEDGNYNLIGEGTLPVDEVMNALNSIDYSGFVSLEWKPEWMPELTDRDVIFPYFVNYLKRYENADRKKKTLYLNHDGTGQYVWRKDELINLTFSRVLDRMVEEFPNQYAFKYSTLDYTRTYEEFRDDVDDFARALVSLGVRPGCKVAVWATNVPEWFIAFWAVTKLGAVLVTMNTAYKLHEAEYLLRQSDTHTLIMIEKVPDSNYSRIINELCPELAAAAPGHPLHCKRLPFLRNVITVGFSQKGCLTFREAMRRCDQVPPEEISRMAAEVRPDDVCNMQYTSGTTGFPKGVMLTHYNVINNGKCIGDRMGLSTADRMMIQVPMFHCFGMVLSMTAAMTHGVTQCPLPYFSAKASLSCINLERITCFNGVPTMFIAMFNHPDYRKTDFSYMRTGIMAGSGCPPELMKRAADPNEMNMTGIVSVYGQTESAPGSTMSAWTDDLELRCTTVGYDFPHIECKIIDPETGRTLPDGQIGEFCSRGYNTMKGYYKMPHATANAVDKDGWLHSGDLACRSSDGTYRITGRLKDMIIRGGENVYPREIEEFIYTNPKVRDVQVIGVPDEKYGEEVMACIILREPGSMSEQEMREFLAAGIAKHKVPRYIAFMNEFPMNAAGKVLKYKMRENFRDYLR